MNVYVFPNLDKTNCKKITMDACRILNSEGSAVFMEERYRSVFSSFEYIHFTEESRCIQTSDFIVVIGGDGTILKCAGAASVYKKPILGINCGRLGFMASLEHTELDRLKALCRGDYNLSSRMMLKIEIISSNGEKLVFSALNDAVISKCDDCKIADFKVSKGGQVISSLRADGVIFSTATGATAYSMSAGGPIIEPEMECIEFTQICAHSLFARSMIFSPESVIDVKCRCNYNSHSVVNVDGNVVYRLSNDDSVRISKASEHLDIIDIAGGSFFTSINKKLMQPLKGISEES